MKNIKISSSRGILIGLILAVSVYIVSIVEKHYMYENTKIDSIKMQMEENFSRVLKNLYFSVNIVEQIAINDYLDTSTGVLDNMFKPIVESFGYRSVAILPKGVVEYIYPLESNEKAIGDNIFEMPDRVVEAELAVETREIIMSGPYEITQGGEAFIMRRAVFINNELWGFVAVVMDKDELIEQLDLSMLNMSNYEYQFSATVNNLDKKIIIETDGFNNEKAKWSKIELANGHWEIGIFQEINIVSQTIFILLLVMGYIVAFIVAYIVKNIEDNLKDTKEEVFTDKLTGVNNRKSLEEINNNLIRNSITYTVIYIDLNDFKIINDTYGHNKGDEVLVIFSNRLKSIIRDTDFIIRMGGDEFIVILPHVDNEIDVQKFCQRLKAIELPFKDTEYSNKRIKFTYGYATARSDKQTLDEVIAIADKNMYTAKHEKRKSNVR